ncbi:CoA transferase [Arthrobacter sp. MYb213]|uniref:CoA transferase n=1 Tax=Arthrobacter sp. MYb213 TaxID=1848595 RepID=UPI0015E31058|nr:CoA transferase [Arthrobacter sp. MYb213]
MAPKRFPAHQFTEDSRQLPRLDTDFVHAGLADGQRTQHWDGPRRWWGGPLDVEGLALAATELCVATINKLVNAEGMYSVDAHGVAQVFASSEHLKVDGRQIPSFGANSRFFRTRDGWIRTHANYEHHQRALHQALNFETTENLSEYLLTRSAEEAAADITGHGAIATSVRSRAQWNNTEMGKSASRGPWADFTMSEVTQERLWTYSADPAQPLRGLRVLDFTRVIAGPTASRTLALWSAEVLRIDPPHMPELNGQYIVTGFGKKSIEADLREVHQLREIQRLLAGADVVLLGYRPGALDAFGLNAHLLREKYPNLIIGELCAWGYDGPYAFNRGFDSIVQAACGIAEIYQDVNGEPGALPVQALDHSVGYGLAAAIIALADARRVQGRTGHVRFSLARTAASLLELPVTTAPVERLQKPVLRTMGSTFGTLSYVPPPFRASGMAMDYLAPPPPYGANAPVWS